MNLDTVREANPEEYEKLNLEEPIDEPYARVTGDRFFILTRAQADWVVREVFEHKQRVTIRGLGVCAVGYPTGRLS